MQSGYFVTAHFRTVCISVSGSWRWLLSGTDTGEKGPLVLSRLGNATFLLSEWFAYMCLCLWGAGDSSSTLKDEGFVILCDGCTCCD